MLPNTPPGSPALIAILRGVVPERVVRIGQILLDAGIRVIEVPMNSPRPLESIALLSKAFDRDCLCGAGTVLDINDVGRVQDAGGRLIVTPNTDPGVVAEASKRGLTIIPGFATPSEAFVAIRAGATHLKLFPASTYGAAHLKAIKAVLPSKVQVYAVGGIGADQVEAWVAAGASGFGFGSELFRPEYDDNEIATRAKRLVESIARIVKT
jgi:2-dehydro-3-deoxyphosphogalactonate aldolase